MVGSAQVGAQSDENSSHGTYQWITVQTKRRRVHSPPLIENTPPPPPVALRNVFAPLDAGEPDKEMDTQNLDDEFTSEEASKKSAAPPPIIFPPIDNINEFTRELNKVIGMKSYDYSTQRNGNIRVNCDRPDSYRELVRYCRVKNHQFHTYQLKEERAFRCVIEGLHNSTDKEYIKSELLKNGHTARNITVARHRIEKYPIDYFFVDLEPADNNKEVYDIMFIGNAKINIVPPRKVKAVPPQCHRCQQYGHTRSYCNNPWRCVKCAGDHATTACTKSQTEAARCCFCNGPHPSNYRGCETFKRLHQQRQIQRPVNNRSTAEYRFDQQDFPNTIGADVINTTQQGNTYASITRPSVDDRLFVMLDRLDKSINKQMDMMTSMIHMMTTFMVKCK